jgi:hypothetical protein
MAKTLKTIPGSIDLKSLGQRMNAVDLKGVPPHKRRVAIMDHFLKIQEDTIEDREIAAQINISRRIINRRTR